MIMEKVRLGIIGFGNMGTNHFKNIMNGKCPEIVVTAVADGALVIEGILKS